MIPPAGRVLTGRPRTPVALISAAVGPVPAADGTYQFTDAPPSIGAFKYQVYWPGNSWFRGSGSSVTVTVALYEPTLTVAGPTTGNVGERLEFSGTFGADGITFPRTIITVSRKVVSPDGTATSKHLVS
ncbi:hypothetical protein ACIBO2_12695 [Nonomuraea sp. NPDC050022]|uniref:hypothetical protein n=1 Tax=unclassified Nonomuraea TaxID=2593643 RepID=UPI0033D1E034